MVLANHVCARAFSGDVDAVKAWLAANPRDLNEFSQTGHIELTLLGLAVTPGAGPAMDEGKLSLVRWLVAQGADLSIYDTNALTPLYLALSGVGRGPKAVETISLLLGAAPLESQIANGMTPLRSPLVHGFGLNTSYDNYSSRDVVEVVKLLLRAGAPLDDYAAFAERAGFTGESPFPADACLTRAETMVPALAQNEGFVETKAMIAGVRACGGRWSSYCRLEHKSILRLRSLTVRKRARTKHKALAFLCRAPNGVAWNVLSYWRATQ